MFGPAISVGVKVRALNAKLGIVLTVIQAQDYNELAKATTYSTRVVALAYTMTLSWYITSSCIRHIVLDAMAAKLKTVSSISSCSRADNADRNQVSNRIKTLLYH